MATIYTYETSETITDGLQGSSVCDDAIRAARDIAKNHDSAVVLDDDDGIWIVTPDHKCRPATAQEMLDGGFPTAEEVSDICWKCDRQDESVTLSVKGLCINCWGG